MQVDRRTIFFILVQGFADEYENINFYFFFQIIRRKKMQAFARTNAGNLPYGFGTVQSFVGFFAGTFWRTEDQRYIAAAVLGRSFGEQVYQVMESEQ